MTTLEQELIIICNRFKADTTKTGKLALLNEYKDNENFKQYLKYVLDPMYTYGLQDKKIKKFLGTHVGEGRGSINIFGMFEHLAVNNTGTDVNANQLARFIDSFEDEDMKLFLLESFTKKMKLGISPKTVNKVYGKWFINNIEIMLAKKYEEEAHKIEGKEIVITEKFDGQRCVFIKEDQELIAYSREAIPIEGFVDIEKELMQLPNGVYDGELLCYNHEELKDREVLQETLKITRKDGDKHGLFFYIFDYVTLEEFDKGKSKGNYVKRREILSEILSTVAFKELVQIPILYRGTDHSVIGDMIEVMDAKGREGLMINVVDAPYECKRTHNILKLKTMQTADLKVIGFEEGSGKNRGSLGALICNYKGFELKVGSGLTDGDRREFFDNQEKYLNKIITVQYFRESKNEQGGLSVSFPVYVCIRDDKEEESYY